MAAATRGVTAFQLADSTLYALKRAQIPVISEVLKLGHGQAALICKSAYGPEIHVSIDCTVTDSRTLAAFTCRPTTSWKRLDGGASWAIAGTLEHHVRAALLEHCIRQCQAIGRQSSEIRNRPPYCTTSRSTRQPG
ncbi:hypothetical protein [Streptomyces fagopyri]|uniref:hypothetical protein n=1 Tax=Streptomyces fagopyri TaxID=2662397 RepID=UPI0038283CB7